MRPSRVHVIGAVLVAVLLVASLAAIYVALRQLGEESLGVDSAWVLEQTGASTLRARGLSGAGVAVCILDSGFDATHPEFKGANLSAWRDFVGQNAEPYDDNGHGTYMASLIVARGRVTGVAHNVSLQVGKVTKADGEGSDADAAAGIDFCLEKQADVISLSLGGKSRPLHQTLTEKAAGRAIALGVIVVASAGNDGPDNADVSSPAALPAAIAVGAVDSSKRIAGFSSKGANSPVDHPPFGRQDPDRKPETVSPGVGVPGAWTEGRYVVGDGSSQATALVSGIIALLLESHPEYKRKGAAMVAQFKSRLMEGSAKSPEQQTPHDDQYGYGVMDAARLDSIL